MHGLWPPERGFKRRFLFVFVLIFSLLENAFADDAAIVNYGEFSGKYSSRQFFQDNIIFVLFFAFVILSVTVFLIIKEFKKNKLYIQKLESAKETGYMDARKFFDCFIGTYLITFYVDLKEKTYISFSSSDSSFYPFRQKGRWSMMQDYVEECVYGDDKPAILEAINPDFIRSKLKIEPRFIVLMRDVSGVSDRWLRYEVMRSKQEGFAAIAISDITSIKFEEERQNKQLLDAYKMAQSADKAKTLFLNNMSHDIRTPMNAIIGFTNLAASHIDEKERLKDYLAKISISSDHLLTLINDILDMTRIESGKVKIEEKEMSIPKLLQDLKIIIQPIIAAKELHFFIDTVDVYDEIVMADKVRLNQVLLNIIGNAVKFTMPGGNISIRIIENKSCNDGYADYEFHVSDTGIGIGKDFIDHVFDSFSRENTSTVSGIQGAGLGLAITKNIVDMMDGSIDVKSEVGLGSEFTVKLKFKLCNETPKFDLLPEYNNKRALVVDDDPVTASSVVKILKAMGMRSESASSGKEAVLRIQLAKEVNDEYHFFVIDYILPEMNGLETASKIRNLVGKDDPIILMSAYEWEVVNREARDCGVTDFLSKPVFANDFSKLLTNSMQKNIIPEVQNSLDFNGKKVLVVEDNELNQEIAKTVLEECGFKVTVVNDGTVAVETILEADEGDFDLILMDVQMPKMNGYDATKQIRKLKNGLGEIPIIAMTANAFEEDIRAALSSGMNDHVAKPIKIEDLFFKIGKYI